MIDPFKFAVGQIWSLFYGSWQVVDVESERILVAKCGTNDKPIWHPIANTTTWTRVVSSEMARPANKLVIIHLPRRTPSV